MANGFSLGLLNFSQDVNKGADPAYKVHPKGFLSKLYVADDPAAIKYDAGQGHIQPVKVKRKQRFTPDVTSTTPSCDVTNTNPYLEDEVSVTGFRQFAFHISNETISQFDKYASAPASVGNTRLMFEFMDTLRSGANALLTAVNRDLITTGLAAIGDHRATGNNTAVALNLPLSTATNPLNQGLNKLHYDYKFNGFNEKPQVVGAGLMAMHMMQQASKSPDQSGINTRIQAAGIDFWWDEDVALISGNAERILVYEPNAVQLIEVRKYQGMMWSNPPGASIFGGLVLPMLAFDGVNVRQIMVYFDYQLRFNDCAEEIGYVNGVEGVTLQPGYNMIVSKTFDLYPIPSNAYRTGDILDGNRGSLAYTTTNA